MSKQNNGRTLFKGGTIVTMDPKVPNLSTGDVLVDGGRIAAVGANLQADGAEVIDAAAASSCRASSMPTIICGSA
jgi:5-methylthioadenosine/S-adenosylhomocysteine deaminase